MTVAKRIKYLLPAELKQRQKVIQKISALFEAKGYEQISTPNFERYDLLSKGLSPELASAAYKFFDHSGHLLILRPDVTTQIAHIVGASLADKKEALRFYYVENVFRAKALDIDQDNQIQQIGLELCNVSGAGGEQEVTELAAKVLKELGLRNFEIAKTDLRQLKKLSNPEREALSRQDFVTLGRLPEKSELLSFDLDYYTGLYFECYVPELGYPLGSGGRYDNLIGKFGAAKPAVGFAFDLHRLMLALKLQKII